MEHAPTPALGQGLALLAAVFWAFAVILFRRSGEHVHPLGLNLFKSILAAVLLLPTMFLAGETLWRPAPTREYVLMLVSGTIGITLGDTFFFLALNALGAGLMAIVTCLYSPFIIALSMLWLGERLRVLQLIGVVMIVSAVFAVTREGDRRSAERPAILRGIVWGVLALASTAVAIVMVKPLLERSPLLWATEIRIFGAIASLTLILLVHPARRAIVGSIGSRQRWRYTLAGSFMGTYCSMICWVGGMKFAPASVASSLNQTSNIFMFIFAALILHEPITRQRVAGILLGVAGAFLVILG